MQQTGIHNNPLGMLQDAHLRLILKPINKYIRDPMHTLASQGVVGTEIAVFFHEIQNLDCQPPMLEQLADFGVCVKMPSGLGKVRRSWFDKNIWARTRCAFSRLTFSVWPLSFVASFKKY